jgi:hypothetical protein
MSLVFLKFSEALLRGLLLYDFEVLARFSGVDHEQAQPGTIPPEQLLRKYPVMLIHNLNNYYRAS